MKNQRGRMTTVVILIAKGRNEVNQKDTIAYGLRVLSGHNKFLLRLKKTVRPLDHGHKVWNSSWLLIDYLQKYQMVSRLRVLDLGCGWGMAGIYCAKAHNADVVWADIDPAVYPYLCLMAEYNNVDVRFLNLGIEKIRRSQLRDIDVIIASDICFCDTLIDPLRRLINRAKAARVKQVLISDPGRWPFDDLAKQFDDNKGGALITWASKHPRKISGKILKINLNTDD